MKDVTLRLIVMFLLSLFLTAFTAGCNTMQGAGEDIQSGGEAIEDAAD